MDKKNEMNTVFFSVKNIEKSYGTGSARVKVLSTHQRLTREGSDRKK